MIILKLFQKQLLLKNKIQELPWYQAVVVVMNQHMRVMQLMVCLMRQYVVKFYISDSDKILDAIKAVDTGDGVLLIVKNYAGRYEL